MQQVEDMTNTPPLGLIPHLAATIALADWQNKVHYMSSYIKLSSVSKNS